MALGLTKNKGIDIGISFDTTGSMFPVLTRVRSMINEITQDLMGDISDIRIGVIAHGDYCDAAAPYTIRIMDFTKDKGDICDFVRDTEATYGGDADECYELVLNKALTTMSWGADREKVLIMIGDANPHEVDYPDNKARLDWKKEASKLGAEGIRVFSVHALANYRSSSTSFYKEVAKRTGGKYLTLDNFTDIVGIIMATCYNEYSEESLDEYVSIIRKKGRMTKALAHNISVISGNQLSEADTKSYLGAEGLIPVSAGRFQVMPIEEVTSIKAFMESNGIEFKAGRVFYELKKTEEIQQYKEIILEDKETGDMFCGKDVRTKLSLLPQCSRKDEYQVEKIKPSKSDTYKVFVQSTSYNRKLPVGTDILYEVHDWKM